MKTKSELKLIRFNGGIVIEQGEKTGLWHELSKNKVLYLMFLPVAVYYLIFAYLPMSGIVVAFKDFNYRDGLFFSPWNGLKNFEYLNSLAFFLYFTTLFNGGLASFYCHTVPAS